MLEFRRNTNDGRTRFQLFVVAFFSIFFLGFFTVSILYRNLPCVLISLVCFSVLFCALVRIIRDLMQPFDHVCTFTPNGVHWSFTNDIYPAGQIDSSNVRTVYIDLDDVGLSFNTGAFLSRGIGADVGLSTDKLRLISDYISQNWTSVTVFCIERGVCRVENGEAKSPNNPIH